MHKPDLGSGRKHRIFSQNTNGISIGDNQERQRTDNRGYNKEQYVNEVIVNQENLGRIDDQQFRRNPFHSHIVAIKAYNSQYPNIFMYGTATVISANLLLTAAHNLYDVDRKRRMTHVLCYVGVNGTADRVYATDEFYYPEQFAKIESIENDFALIKLKSRVVELENPNLMILAVGFKDEEAKLSIFGYPSSNNYKQVNNMLEIFQLGLTRAKRLRQNHEKYMMAYSISTLPGQSGCSIISGPENNLIVGIHKAGAKSKDHNIGRIITLGLLSRMEHWRRLCGGDQFRVVDYQSDLMGCCSKAEDKLRIEQFKKLIQLYQEQFGRLDLKIKDEKQLMIKQTDVRLGQLKKKYKNKLKEQEKKYAERMAIQLNTIADLTKKLESLQIEQNHQFTRKNQELEAKDKIVYFLRDKLQQNEDISLVYKFQFEERDQQKMKIISNLSSKLLQKDEQINTEHHALQKCKSQIQKLNNLLKESSAEKRFLNQYLALCTKQIEGFNDMMMKTSRQKIELKQEIEERDRLIEKMKKSYDALPQ